MINHPPPGDWPCTAWGGGEGSHSRSLCRKPVSRRLLGDQIFTLSHSPQSRCKPVATGRLHSDDRATCRSAAYIKQLWNLQKAKLVSFRCNKDIWGRGNAPISENVPPESTMIWTGSGLTSRKWAGAREAGVAVGFVNIILHNLGDIYIVIKWGKLLHLFHIFPFCHPQRIRFWFPAKSCFVLKLFRQSRFCSPITSTAHFFPVSEIESHPSWPVALCQKSNPHNANFS